MKSPSLPLLLGLSSLAFVGAGCTLVDLSGLQGGAGGHGGAGGAATSSGSTSSGAMSGTTSASSGSSSSSASAGGAGATSSSVASTGTGSVLCGNGNVDNGEECDDGNMADGDGCSSACVLECNLPPGFASIYKDPSTHHCYALGTNTNNQTDSLQLCAFSGQNAKYRFYGAVIHTSAELSLITSHVAISQKTWTSGVYSGGWQWPDAMAIASALWAPSEPSATTGAGAQIDPSKFNKLIAASASVDGWILCERGPNGYADP